MKPERMTKSELLRVIRQCGKAGDRDLLQKLTHQLEALQKIARQRDRELRLAQRALKKSREELLRRDQAAKSADEAKERVLAVLSHELRTPLTPVLATVTAMQARGEVPRRMENFVGMVQRNIELEARLIEDLLDVTRLAREKMRLNLAEVDAHSIVRDVEAMFRHEAQARGLRLVTHLRATDHWVRGDAVRLRQVLWNLLSNAMKFTPRGGTVTVKTSNRQIKRGTPDHPKVLLIDIADTGIGIDGKMLGKLFRPFEQVEPLKSGTSGLGLGLAICRGLVEQHRGTISATSDGHDKGATFHVEFKTIERLEAAHPARPAEEPEHKGGLKILLVEDHPETARVIAELLESVGHRVRVAGSVQSALHTVDGTFALVISDLGLPDGNGLDLMREIHSRYPMKGIALSGYGTERDVQQSLEAGFSEHLTKPVDFRRLMDTIEHLGASAR